MKILATSDTHNERFNDVIKDKYDIFIHAGDLCIYGSEKEFLKGVKLINGIDSELKILVPGNHDKFVEKNPNIADIICKDNNIVLLNHEYYKWKDITFFGSPYVCDFSNGYWAFERRRSEMLNHWSNVTDNVDILITHCPPFGILDSASDHIGSDVILEKVKELKPKLHFFGHCHETGQKTAQVFGTQFYNCAFLTEKYKWRVKGSQRFWVLDF